MTPAKVLAFVAMETGYSVEQIKSAKRNRHLVKARWQAIKELRELGLSLNEIGDIVNKDHTSILNALRNGEQNAQQ